MIFIEIAPSKIEKLKKIGFSTLILTFYPTGALLHGIIPTASSHGVYSSAP